MANGAVKAHSEKEEPPDTPKPFGFKGGQLYVRYSPPFPKRSGAPKRPRSKFKLRSSWLLGCLFSGLNRGEPGKKDMASYSAPTIAISSTIGNFAIA